jgi:hypothetical protein
LTTDDTEEVGLSRSIISLIVFMLLITSVSLLTACGGDGDTEQNIEPGESSVNGQALLEEHCQECHSLTYVTGASKSESGWSQTVDRMIGYGVDIESAERDALVEFLAQEYGQ